VITATPHLRASPSGVLLITNLQKYSRLEMNTTDIIVHG